MAKRKPKIKLNKKQRQFFDGFMAGDGHIEPIGTFRINMKYRELSAVKQNINFL